MRDYDTAMQRHVDNEFAIPIVLTDVPEYAPVPSEHVESGHGTVDGPSSLSDSSARGLV